MKYRLRAMKRDLGKEGRDKKEAEGKEDEGDEEEEKEETLSGRCVCPASL